MFSTASTLSENRGRFWNVQIGWMEILRTLVIAALIFVGLASYHGWKGRHEAKFFPLQLNAKNLNNVGSVAAGATESFLPNGFEKIPDGPRQILVAYWQARSAGEREKTLACLAHDYVSDEGPREVVEKTLQTRSPTVKIVAAIFDIVRCETRDRYERPLTVSARTEKKWEGKICLVEGVAVARKRQLGSGKVETTAPTHITFAIMEEAGSWKLISEHIQSAADDATDCVVAMSGS